MDAISLEIDSMVARFCKNTRLIVRHRIIGSVDEKNERVVNEFQRLALTRAIQRSVRNWVMVVGIRKNQRTFLLYINAFEE